jgi:glycosyltransferase involved in cell wall biosynthesis
VRIYLWEYALSPHLGNVLKGMADRGYLARYVVNTELYESRTAQGWVLPEFPGVEVLRPEGRAGVRAIARSSAPSDVHICVGLRANDFVRNASAELRSANRKFLMFMERIDERSAFSIFKRPLYRLLFFRNRQWLEGVLATGATTADWVANRGVARSRTFEFAYFMPTPRIEPRHSKAQRSSFRILFVGSLIELKNVALVIEALRYLPAEIKLDVVGDGPLRGTLEQQAAAEAPGRVTFHGTRPMPEVSSFMESADCVVLPSDHDGWGAVVVEALLVGTPVVCSDRCGASVAVLASGRGGVFKARSVRACSEALQSQLALGRPTEEQRSALANWARCLTEQAGAEYLDEIISHLRRGTARPSPPWALPDTTYGQRDGSHA